MGMCLYIKYLKFYVDQKCVNTTLDVLDQAKQFHLFTSKCGCQQVQIHIWLTYYFYWMALPSLSPQFLARHFIPTNVSNTCWNLKQAIMLSIACGSERFFLLQSNELYRRGGLCIGGVPWCFLTKPCPAITSLIFM